MRRVLISLAAAMLSFGVPATAAAAAPPHVLLDITYAPEAGDYALKLSPVVLEWYSKINAELYGDDHPLPYEAVVLSFVPSLDYPAATSRNVIRISAAYLPKMRDDYRAMIIHELTHVVQNYPAGQHAGWLVEGIADYVRHKYFEKDIELTLHMNSSGRLTGYTDSAPYNHSLEANGADLTDKGYLKAYTITSTFLYWLEVRKNKDIVRTLNLALSQGHYAPDIFQTACGKPLDDLWAEFVTESETRKH
ncbi:MAG: basic secretory protein-like protein [Rhizomicrobium sp.]|nr:basic secretory protein-like protein [Rhizomicrobium sp.]